jgi:hypothetical protein
MRPIMTLCLAAVITMSSVAAPGRAEPAEFEQFFRQVAACNLDPTRYDLAGRVRGQGDAVMVALPTSGSVRGLLVIAFYFAPGRSNGDQYGLVFNAPLDLVAKAFPELTGRQTVNGHLRRLARLSDETGDRAARRRTLLLCMAGTDT